MFDGGMRGGNGAHSILITGCSSGIGYDAAHTLAKGGWNVFASCRANADCQKLNDEGLSALRLDHADHDSMDAAVADVLRTTGGRLDAVFLNGAYAIPGPLEDIPDDAMDAIFQSNVLGWHGLVRRVLPAMRAQGGGRIVFNSSILGFVPMQWRGAYVATKFAIEGYADVLRMEMREAGIQVSVIQPGPIKTNFRANAIKQFERWVDWESSARVQQYRDSLLDKLYSGSAEATFELPPSAVTTALRHALEAPRPRRRYRVTTPTRGMGRIRGILPGAAMDWIGRRG